MIRIEILAGAARTAFRFDADRISIGSAGSNDIVLNDASVREVHCTVEEAIRSGYYVEVLGEHSLVTDGEKVRIGAYEAVFHDADERGDEEKSFLAELVSKPHDIAVRAVYADWLEEHGRAAEASFIRLQLAIATLSPDDEALAERARELQAMARKMPLSWRRAVARAPIENCDVRFELNCPKRWDALAPTDEPNTRHCNACQKHVHYAPDLITARRLVKLGHCIAVDVGRTRRPKDLEPAEIQMRVGRVMLR